MFWEILYLFYFGPDYLLTLFFSEPKFFFYTKFFCQKIFCTTNFFWKQSFFSTQNFMGQNILFFLYICGLIVHAYRFLHYWNWPDFKSIFKIMLWPRTKFCPEKECFDQLVRQRSYWRRIGEYVQRHVCFDNIQSSLKENFIFSVCALCGQCRIHHIYHMEFHFRFNIISGVAVRVKGHQKKIR